MTTYPCSRCAGTGRMPQHSNVLGGVCFRCNGKGTQASKPTPPTPKWAIFGQHRDSGQWLRLYNVSTKTEAGAIERARATMERASTAWRDTYTLAQARALRWQDMADQQATTWAEATGAKEAA